MGPASRKGVCSAAGVAALVGMAVLARLLPQTGLSPGWLRLAMFAFTLLCPIFLGLAIGVWGGSQAGTWGARGVGATYLGVVGWAWAEDGSFPVGFRLAGFETPLFVTLINIGIFLITVYFMQALGRSGGHLGARFAASPHAPAATAARTDPAFEKVSSLPDMGGTEGSTAP